MREAPRRQRRRKRKKRETNAAGGFERFTSACCMFGSVLPLSSRCISSLSHHLCHLFQAARASSDGFPLALASRFFFSLFLFVFGSRSCFFRSYVHLHRPPKHDVCRSILFPSLSNPKPSSTTSDVHTTCALHRVSFESRSSSLPIPCCASWRLPASVSPVFFSPIPFFASLCARTSAG